MASSVFKAAGKQLEKLGLSYPETHVDHPWGETALKVKGKVFVFMRYDDKTLGLSVKLPKSGALALMQPYCEPTGYGLGKSGWVSATFEGKVKPPMKLLSLWVEESYRAVAPAKVVAQLDGGALPTKPVKAKKKQRRA